MTTASADVLVGSEVPRLFTAPARPLTPQTTRGFEAIAFAEDVLGVALMPWQKWALIHGLELTETGAYRLRVLLCLAARQQGKSTLLQVLALWRLYVDRAPLVIGAAQNLSLAEETWDGAVSMAEGIPDLASELAQVSRVNGDKFMRLTGGERYKVTTATRRGGRGLSSDLVLLDELREHQSWDAWGAITKTTMARPSPQVVGFSNAGDSRSIVLADLREKALAAREDPASTLGIFEWSAPDGCDLDDRQAWAQANPALGHTTSPEAIASALQTDPEDVFRTEVLCSWVASIGGAISAPVWQTLPDPRAQRGTSMKFALDVAPDHSSATVAAAWKREDGLTHVSVVEHRPGVDWVVGRVVELQGHWGHPLIVEQNGTGSFLLPAFERAGLRTETVARRFYADACSAFDVAVTSRAIRHDDQPELNIAVAVARWSSSGEAGQRLYSRKDPRVSPLVAVVLAHHSLTAAPPSNAGWFMAFS